MNFESTNNKLKKIKAAIPKVIDARKEVVEKRAQKVVGSSLLIAVSAIPKQLKVDENKAKPIILKVAAAIPKVVDPIEKTIDKRKDVVKEKENQKKETVDKKTKEVKNDKKEKKERILDKVKEEWKNASTVVKRGIVTTGAVAAPGVITAREKWADFADRLLGRGKYTKADARKIGERGKVNIKPKVKSEIIGKIGDEKGTDTTFPVDFIGPLLPGQTRETQGTGKGEYLKTGVSPIGVSIDEINARANRYVNELLMDILLENDDYLYKNSVLSYRISDLKVQLNRHKAIGFIGYLTSKDLKDFISEIELGSIDGVVPDATGIIKYGMEKEITITINQIKNLGDYKYLIHDKGARKMFVHQLDLEFDKHAKINLNVYKEKDNNEILKSKILTRIMEVKMINSNYNESKTNYEYLKDSVRRETEEVFSKEAEKQIEELMRVFLRYPTNS